jgi:hypothetical protein
MLSSFQSLSATLTEDNLRAGVIVPFKKGCGAMRMCLSHLQPTLPVCDAGPEANIRAGFPWAAPSQQITMTQRHEISEKWAPRQACRLS